MSSEQILKGETAVEEKALDELFAQLDERIAALQNREISLEESFRIYEEGMKLVKLCEDRIDLVDKQVMMIGDDGQISAPLPEMNDAGRENRGQV